MGQYIIWKDKNMTRWQQRKLTAWQDFVGSRREEELKELILHLPAQTTERPQRLPATATATATATLGSLNARQEVLFRFYKHI